MATIQEILDKINASKSNNVNNNSFIDLMRQISGNPEDATAPVNDTNSIYGHIVQMYTTLYDGGIDYAVLADEVDMLQGVYDNLIAINSVHVDKTKLDSIYADKIKLDQLFADKAVIDRVYGSITNIDRVHTSIDKLDTVYASVLKMDIVADNIADVNTVADNMTVLNEIYNNRVEIYAADDNAAIATTKASEASASAATTLGYKNDVSAMKLAVETIYDTFDDRFLGTKIVDPTLDNDGNVLIDGAMYFNTSSNAMKVYDVGTATWYSIPQIYLSGLLDVELISITTGDTLVWNGTKWINVLLTKASVGLANVDNTSDTSKPVSTAQQTALNLKANSASPTFTGTVSGVTKAMVGLGSVDNTADSEKNVLSATKLATARTINGVSFNGTANITTYDSTKVAKVASTDNDIVRFNGAAGEVQGSGVTIDDGGNLTSARIVCAGGGNAYSSGGIEVRGNGSTVFPTIGFHHPGVYGGTLQQVSDLEFSFFAISEYYATLKNNINMQNAINVHGTVGGSVLASNVIVESGLNANGSYTKFANGSRMEYKLIGCEATANVRYIESITWPISGAVAGTSYCVYVVNNTLEYVFSQQPAFNYSTFYFVANTTQTYYFILTKYTP